MGKRNWTNEEIKILYENFPEGGIYKCMELLPNRKRSQIKAKIDSLHIKSNHHDKWTDEDNEKLKEAWETYSMEELLKAFPGRSYQKIQLHANWLGYRSKTNRKRKCDLSFLDLNKLTKDNAYWWGFIMADGHISKKGQIVIQLKNVDENHLQKIACHLNGNVKKLKNDFVRLACNDIKKVNEWRNILEMKESAKTYFPPSLKIFEPELIYFFVGFVDGDGCIWRCKDYPLLKIELHASWKENLDLIASTLKEKYGINSIKTKISKRGTAVLSIENRNDLINILKYAKEVESLDRKWNKII